MMHWIIVFIIGLIIGVLAKLLVPGPDSGGIIVTALLGIAGFVLFAIFGAVLLYTDWPLTVMGRAAQGVRNWFTRGRRPPTTGLDKRLLAERDTIRTVLGEKWWQAALLTAGRLGFDYGCLLAELRATAAYASSSSRVSRSRRARASRSSRSRLPRRVARACS